MAEVVQLKAEARADNGRGASRELRRKGMVPAVIYGGNEEPIAIHLEEKALNKALGTGHFFNSIVEITVGGNTPTVADAVTSLDRALVNITTAEGHMPRQHRRGAANLFSTYTLRGAGAWYDQLTLGGGANYRSKPVTGYDTITGDHVFGGESLLVNAMLQRTWKLRRGTIRAQLNVDNVLDRDDFIITDKDNTGTYRVLFQQPRRWAISLTRSI